MDSLLLVAALVCFLFGTEILSQSDQASPALVVQMGHAGLITAIAFSPNDQVFATAGEDSRIKLWHTATGLELRTIEDEMPDRFVGEG